MEELNRLLKIHLGHHDYPNRDWYLGTSPISGRGVFAKIDLKPGDVVFEDIPLIAGPRLKEEVVVCCSCLRGDVDVRGCDEGCGLPVCSGECARSDTHRPECALLRTWRDRTEDGGSWSTNIYLALMPVRSLFLDNVSKRLVRMMQANRGPQHGLEVGLLKEGIRQEALSKEDEAWMTLWCEVVDATAFEIERVSWAEDGTEKRWSLRGLFPLAGLVNHSCSPNTRHLMVGGDAGQDVMRFVAARGIAAGEEVTTHYCPLLWSTPPRRHHLATTKHFLCNCQRCADPTEFGTFLSAVKCESCAGGKLLPVDSLDLCSDWGCDSCAGLVGAREAILLQARAGNRASRTDLPPRLHFLSQTTVQIKLKNIWNHAKSLPELSFDELREDEVSIRDILSLIENLRLGQCRMRGLLLFELYNVLKDMERRNHNEECENEEMKTILEEAVAILKDDRGAPYQLRKIIDSRSERDKPSEVHT